MSAVQLINGVYKANPNQQKEQVPDENGYYTLIVGGLNCFNSYGAYYVAKNSIELFNSSSDLMRRINGGQLRGELGHPKREPGTDLNSWINRAMTIEEKNVCCHISEVWLDLEYGKKNPEHKNPYLVAIYAKVRPAGPHGPILKAAFENPKENVGFSIRSLTDDRRVGGRLEKTLVQVITWDYVNDPGISMANAWSTPTVEDHVSTVLESDVVVDVLKRNNNIHTSNESGSMLRNDTIERIERMSNKEHIGKRQSVLDRW